MEVQCVPRGVILPQRQDKKGPRWGLGGVCDEQGKFVALSAYDGGWATHGGSYPWQDEQYLDVDVVYFGTFFVHWGHFLIDMIGRLWYFAEHKNKKQKLAYIGTEPPIGNFVEFFSLLGIEPEDILYVTEPTRFRSVIVPEFCCKSCVWYSDEYRSIFDAMIRRVELEGYVPERFKDVKKVYFARTAFGKAKGSEFGEDLIVAWMEANGFAVVAPEQLSVRDQIYIWNHAEEIGCLNGSIPMSVAFSQNRDLRLIVLNKTHLEHLNLELFLLMRPCQVDILDVWYEPFKKYPKNIGAGPFLLHLGEDAQAYSACRGWAFPFEERMLLRQRRKNKRKMMWAILDIRGRLYRIAYGVYSKIKKLKG